MSRNELHETLLVIARTPGQFRRDTPMLLKALDRVEEIKQNLKQQKEPRKCS